jgi:hypothetical protein
MKIPIVEHVDIFFEINIAQPYEYKTNIFDTWTVNQNILSWILGETVMFSFVSKSI